MGAAITAIDKAKAGIMGSIQLALCDDEEYFIEVIRDYLITYENESGDELVATAYLSGAALIEALGKDGPQYDIFILDVDMPELKGTEAARRIRGLCPQAVICFITAFEEYAFEAYQAEALGYLKKPVPYKEFKRLLSRCVAQARRQEEDHKAQTRFLEVKTNQGSRFLLTDDIFYVEKRRNQCVFHMEDGEVFSYATLMDIYEKLDESRFYYVHQGYIVNFEKIREVKSNAVCLEKGVEVPVSRRYRAKLRQMHLNKIRALCKEVF